jgi:hypothetical protein
MVCVLWYADQKTCYMSIQYTEQVSFYTEYTLNMSRFILSIRWTCVILYWVYAEHVSLYTEYTLNQVLIYTEYTLIVIEIEWRTFFYTECTLNRAWITLSIRWTSVNFHWVYAEQGLKYTEYTLNGSRLYWVYAER